MVAQIFLDRSRDLNYCSENKYIFCQLIAVESRKYLLAHFVKLIALPVDLNVATHNTLFQPLSQALLFLGSFLHILLAEAIFSLEILVNSISVLTYVFLLNLNFPSLFLNGLI